MPNWEAYKEAYRRGILPSEKKALYEEAMRRGLVPGIQSQTPESKSFWEKTVESLGQKSTWKGFLPATGSIVGTVAGAPFGGPAGMALGGMTGAVAGKGIENILFGPKKPQQVAQEMGTEATFAGLGELGGPLAAKALRPMGSRITPMAEKVIDLIKKESLPLRPSILVPSKATRLFEWVGEGIPGGGGTRFEAGRTKLQEGLSRLVNETLEILPRRTGKFEAGMELAESLKSAKANLRQQTQKAYGKFTSQLQKTMGTESINVENLKKVLEKSVDQFKRGTRAHDTFSMMLDRINRGGGLTGEQIDILQKQIWDLTWPKKAHIGRSLWDALETDLTKESSVFKGLLERAKDASKLEKTFNRNVTVKAILKKYATDPENVIRDAFRSGNLNDVKLIQKAVDKETWDLARSRFVENLINASMDTTGIEPVFRPGIFVKNFEKYEPQIAQTMPDVYENIKDFTRISRAAVEELKRKAPFGTGMQMLVRIGGGLGAATSHRPELAAPMGFSWILAKSLVNPKGWMKTWLTKGFEGPVAKAIEAAPRLGGRAIMFKEKE